MSTSVYDWNANPAVDRRLYPISDHRAEEMVTMGFAKFILLETGRKALQKLPPLEVMEERAARNALAPFGRGPVGLTKAPPKINYPVPAIVDHRLSWHYSFMHTRKEKDFLEVSAGTGSHRAAAIAPTHPVASAVPAG